MLGWSTSARKRFSASAWPSRRRAGVDQALEHHPAVVDVAVDGQVDPAEAAVGDAAAHLVLARRPGRRETAWAGTRTARRPRGRSLRRGRAGRRGRGRRAGRTCRRTGGPRAPAGRSSARRRGRRAAPRARRRGPRRACRGWSRWRSCGPSHGRTDRSPGCPPAGCLPPTAPPGRTGRAAARCPRAVGGPARRRWPGAGRARGAVGGRRRRSAGPRRRCRTRRPRRPRCLVWTRLRAGHRRGPVPPQRSAGPRRRCPARTRPRARAPTPHRGPRPPPGGRTRRSSRRR